VLCDNPLVSSARWVVNTSLRSVSSSDSADDIGEIADCPDTVWTIASDDSPDSVWHFARASNLLDGVEQISQPR
jgi:hypothetical protein